MKQELIKIEPKAINYLPGSISFAEGFLDPKGDVGFFMKADYERAVFVVDHLVSQGKKISRVDMGLDGDWRENSMTIYAGGEFTEYSLYDVSQWAEPIIIVYYSNAPSEAYSVWKREEK